MYLLIDILHTILFKYYIGISISLLIFTLRNRHMNYMTHVDIFDLLMWNVNKFHAYQSNN